MGFEQIDRQATLASVPATTSQKVKRLQSDITRSHWDKWMVRGGGRSDHECVRMEEDSYDRCYGGVEEVGFANRTVRVPPFRMAIDYFYSRSSLFLDPPLLLICFMNHLIFLYLPSSFGLTFSTLYRTIPILSFYSSLPSSLHQQLRIFQVPVAVLLASVLTLDDVDLHVGTDHLPFSSVRLRHGTMRPPDLRPFTLSPFPLTLTPPSFLLRHGPTRTRYQNFHYRHTACRRH